VNRKGEVIVTALGRDVTHVIGLAIGSGLHVGVAECDEQTRNEGVRVEIGDPFHRLGERRFLVEVTLDGGGFLGGNLLRGGFNPGFLGTALTKERGGIEADFARLVVGPFLFTQFHDRGHLGDNDLVKTKALKEQGCLSAVDTGLAQAGADSEVTSGGFLALLLQGNEVSLELADSLDDIREFVAQGDGKSELLIL